jgi:E3 ubiquitin-protein ligase KEG
LFDLVLLLEGRELVRILLASGADPTAQDAQHGRTALHTASMANDVELVKVFKKAFPLHDIRK